jgi:MFS family permease
VRELAARAARRTFRALRVRNFRLFFAGQLISQVGTWLTTIALTLLVLELTHSGVAIGLLAAAQFGPILLFGAWGGLVADRSDKHKLLIVTQTLEMLQSFALAVLAFMHDPPVVAFYLTAAAGGFMLAFDNPTRRSFVSEMVPEDTVQNAVTLNTALMTTSRVIGPALAGLLVVTTGFAWCFLIDGLSYLAVIGSLLMMRRSELHQPPVVARARGQLRAAFRYIGEVPDLWIPLTMMTVVGTLTFNFTVVIPLFVKHTFHGTDEAFTLLYSVLSVGSVMGALAASHQRVIDARHVAGAAIAFGATMAVFAVAPTLGSAFPFALLVGFASVAFITSATATVQVRADPAMRGRVLALQSMLLIGTTPIGGPLLGWICDLFGARVAIMLGAVAALAAGTWGWVAVRRLREHGRATAPEDIGLVSGMQP